MRLYVFRFLAMRDGPAYAFSCLPLQMPPLHPGRQDVGRSKDKAVKGQDINNEPLHFLQWNWRCGECGAVGSVPLPDMAFFILEVVPCIQRHHKLTSPDCNRRGTALRIVSVDQ